MFERVIITIFFIFYFITGSSQTITNSQSLPILRLTGSFGKEYQQGSVSIEYPDGSKTDNMSAKLKWRGGTTNADGKHKRNYKIKFTKKYSFFDMRKDDSWILDAGQADVFRLRNRIATELWNDFATKPYYIDQESTALSCVRGQVVEVYLNDEYVGIYSFTECMDRKQMALKKFSDDGTIHGLLWKSTSYGCSMMYEIPESYDNSQPMMDVFEAKYPELDDLPQTDYSVLWNAINFVINSSDDEFRKEINDYFDIPVFIDYFLFINVLGAFDNIGKNMYWAVYDKEINKKITLAVWDLDLTVGSILYKQYSESFMSPEAEIIDGFNIIKRLKTLNVNDFNQKLKKRYASLRKDVFSPDRLIARYQKYYHLLVNSGAAEREEKRWSGDSDVFGEVIDFDAEIQYISNWFKARIQYLDKNVFDYNEFSNIEPYPVIDNAKSTFIYNLNGQRMNNAYPLKNGFYICNGHKYICR